jgi:uncharacterized protein YbaR (Trm112 family)
MVNPIVKFRWGFRKLNLPVRADDFVLEVGSGGNPHPYANILLEKYVDNTHRYINVKFDRDAVLADACQMPFCDDAFDYSIAFHVLEHVKTPELFLAEMSRVSRAGYIETPNVFYERATPFDCHVTEIALVGEKLLIRPKIAEIADPFISGLEILKRSPEWSRFFRNNPEAFHVCLKWQGQIDYEFIDPEINMDWFHDPEPGFVEDETPGANAHGGQGGSRLNNLIGKAARTYREKKRKQKKGLPDVLVCPLTKGPLVFAEQDKEYISESASLAYPVKNGIPVMLINDARRLTV